MCRSNQPLTLPNAPTRWRRASLVAGSAAVPSSLPRSSNRALWRVPLRRRVQLHTTAPAATGHWLQLFWLLLSPVAAAGGGRPAIVGAGHSPRMLTAVGFVSTQSAPAPRWVQLPSSSLSAPGAHFSSRLVFSRRAVRWCCALALGLFYFFFIKLRYKGKSYKWHRRRGALVLRFGYSHTALSYIPRRVFVRRAGKMKMVFFGTCLWELRSLLAGAIRWRPMNVYNGRGLRFARQLVFRKFGKVSAYR